MVTIIDVAKSAEVSPAIVSRVVNGDETLRISPETRARVLAAVSEMHYAPSHAARSLRMNVPSVISLVIPDTTSTINSNLLRGVEDAARARNLAVNIVSAELLESGMETVLRFIKEGRTDGLLLQVPDKLPASIEKELGRLTTPLTLLNSSTSGSISTVALDDAAGVSVAYRHLVEMGHTKIGFVGGFPTHAPAKRRQKAYENLNKSHNLAQKPEWTTNLGLSNEAGVMAAEYFMKLKQRPTAVIVANVNAAMGFIAQCHRLGANLPQEMSIISIHDVPYAEATWPPLSAVAMPFYQLGFTGVEILFSNTGEAVHKVIKNPIPELRSRESVLDLRSIRKK